MKVLRAGDRGDEVESWQHFLIGQGFSLGTADGIFGQHTKDATIAFQRDHNLGADGIVGQGTLGQAAMLGFEIASDDAPATDTTSANFPPPPGFSALTRTEDRQSVFGKFSYEVTDTAGDIRVTDGWAAKNIIAVTLPFPTGLPGAPSSKQVAFHRLAAKQLVALWDAWASASLLDRVLTWDGSYAPRLTRGLPTLSNHAFGSAFDINERWNPLGAQPALVGQKGSVRELVQLANEHGFYWGGHFRSRKDGMHFEIARLL
jgi:D-alanyl-D-alanine carboxypeptidase/Putative peptidoglycan binding domain